MKVALLDVENAVNLTDLEKMSTADIVTLYNTLADKQVKRMASRADAERRTIEALKEAGKWEEPGTEPTAAPVREARAPKGKKGGEADAAPLLPPEKKPAAKVKPSPTSKIGGKEPDKVKAPIAKPTKTKPEKVKKQPAPAAGNGRGAPRKNPVYIPFAGPKTKYNPKGLRINPNSARKFVLDFIEKNPAGKTRDQIEQHFSETELNVKSALDFCIKYGFASIKE